MTDERIALFGGAPTLNAGAHRSWPQIEDDERRAVDRVLARGVLSGATAPECVAFENEFAKYTGSRHALLTHSGTSALHLALAAVGVGQGAEGQGAHVIVPAYSFVATPLAVLHAGAIPIFCDVDESTGLMDTDDVARAIGPRTRAIMPVHVHGCAIDLGPLLALAEKHRLAIVEDAAQAHGALWDGKPVGAIGRSGGFSLQSSKNLGVGEGGVFVTNDDALAEAANRIRNFGQDVALADRAAFDDKRPLDGSRALASGKIGWMYRGNELTAAIARAALAKLPERTAACQENAGLLSKALGELDGVTPPEVPRGSTSVHHKFRVRFDLEKAGIDSRSISPRAFRDAMIRALRAEGLEVVLWQVAPLSAQPVFRDTACFPWSSDRETDFAATYDPAKFPRTQRMLDASLLLFSQSCPLIAQSRETALRYAEGFAKVWRRRGEIAAWAKREGLAAE